MRSRDEEREERHVGLGASRVLRAKSARSLQELADLVGRVDVRDSAPPRESSERPGGRKLVALVLDLHSPREAPYDGQALPSLPGRRSLSGPGECGGTADEGVALQLGEPREVAEKALLQAELEPELTVKIDVAGDVVGQHCAPSGQGWATLCSRATSTLA